MSRADQAQDAAAAWIIRREAGGWSDADQAEFERWLAESDGNKAAYWRLKHSWGEADRIGSLGIAADDMPTNRGIARYWKPAALAASLALMIGVGTFRYEMPRPAPQVAAARFDTPVGGHETVSLADGSRIELNTRTLLRAAVTRTARQVWLDRGEAFFQIAHDAAHPFVILAGPKRITVLGTKFSVRRDGDKVSVSVLEGRVRIDDATAPGGTGLSSATITGGVLAVSQGPSTLVTQKSEERVQDALAWRDGMLKFDQTPLSEVADEFNRYNRRQMVVTDPAAAGIRIGGAFQASNVDAFARLLHEAYGLKVTTEADDIKISG
jgi:transmembrane sensor